MKGIHRMKCGGMKRAFVHCSMFNKSVERKRPQRMFMVTQLNVIDFFS